MHSTLSKQENMAEFLLSDFTQGRWLDKGGLQLSRIKEEDGDFDRGYKVYLAYHSGKALVKKRENIQKCMEEIKGHLIPTPCNITLHNSQVMRLSEFFEDYYYGIHTLDGEGKVRIGRGMNLTEAEYEELLNKLVLHFPPDQKVLQASSKLEFANFEKTKRKVKRLKKVKASTLHELKVAPPVSANEEMDPSMESDVVWRDDVTTPKEQFIVIQYGWSWNAVTESLQLPVKQSQGGLYFDAKDCYEEASKFEP